MTFALIGLAIFIVSLLALVTWFLTNRVTEDLLKEDDPCASCSIGSSERCKWCEEFDDVDV